MTRLEIVPVTLKVSLAFVAELHRHNKPPRGHKFSIGVRDVDNGGGRQVLRGVAISGRPVARVFDDGMTIEVLRVCTDGARNACSMLYGASRRAALAMGYRRGFTYTQADEPGSSLLASGWTRDDDIPARGSWADHTQDPRLREMRDAEGNGGVPRVRWIWTA